MQGPLLPMALVSAQVTSEVQSANQLSPSSAYGVGSSAHPWTTTASRVAATLGPTVFPFQSLAPPSACIGSTFRHVEQSTVDGARWSALKHPEIPQTMLPQAWVPAGARSGCAKPFEPLTRSCTAPIAKSRVGPASRIQKHSNSSRVGSKSPQNAALGEAKAGKQARPGRVAEKGRQDRIAERLANATAAPPDPAGFERSEFLCADGVTLMPYAIVGIAASPSTGVGETRRGAENQSISSRNEGEAVQTAPRVLNFVVVHDFFDTLEKTFLLFKPLVLRHPGCQVLCFNSPGQSGTRLPPEPEGLLTNVWVADRLDELMQVK